MTETLVQAWTRARRRLEAAGIDGPVLDARLLVEAAAGASRSDILTDPHRALSAEQVQTLDSYLDRRIAREPVSHILGRKGFWTIELKVTPDVLTPRPDTETIVGAVLKCLKEDGAADILDLGSGSGAILLAILSERLMAHGVGVDVSAAAIEVARENAALLGLQDRAAFLHASWTEGQPDDAFDIVVSNPPYIPTGDIAGLEPEVAEREPRLALDGGADGLDAYRLLAPEVLRVLKPGGLFALEIGHDQGAAVKAMMTQAGGAAVQVLGDLGGRDRAIFGRKPG
ncbi:MAG TPA: peptide chain release factor N(5)-glutamine methyltransferase [Caulobacteraceae bacterium]|nr:peptide chain release factor N(5)-glutamine methyltransferase [Caulobacteraceae bacterium]